MHLTRCAIRLLPAVCFAVAVVAAANFTKGSTTSAWLACSYSILPASNSYTADATSDTVQVSTQTGCNWKAISNDGWISITSAPFGSGSGPFTFNIEANTADSNTVTPSRTGTITVTDNVTTTLTFTATQSGCSFSLNSNNASVPADAGTYGVSVLTGNTQSCPWTASSGTSWIMVNTASGLGDKTAA